MKVQVEYRGQRAELVLDCMRINSVKLDQRDPESTRYLTGRLLLSYPEHFASGLCKKPTGQGTEEHATIGASEALQTKDPQDPDVEVG